MCVCVRARVRVRERETEKESLFVCASVCASVCMSRSVRARCVHVFANVCARRALIPTRPAARKGPKGRMMKVGFVEARLPTA